MDDDRVGGVVVVGGIEGGVVVVGGRVGTGCGRRGRRGSVGGGLEGPRSSSSRCRRRSIASSMSVVMS